MAICLKKPNKINSLHELPKVFSVAHPSEAAGMDILPKIVQ
jgi:hypothetical protein